MGFIAILASRPCRGWKSPDATGLETLWIEKHSNTNKRISTTFNDHRGTSDFGVPSIDGSPVPLGSTATNETTGIPKPFLGRVLI